MTEGSHITHTFNPVQAETRDLLSLRPASARISLKPGRILSRETGLHMSPFRGRGLEFDEVRPYQAGDDIRNIDWRVTARTGRTHTKLFCEERERSVMLWVDLRAPMFFATRGCFKSVWAARAASLLSWRAVGQGDRLGGLIFSENRHQELKPRRGRVAVLRMIHGLVEGTATQTAVRGDSADRVAQQALIRLKQGTHPGSLIVMCSDFQYLGEKSQQMMVQLSRHNDLLLLFIYDPLEKRLPKSGTYRISDGVQTRVIQAGSKKVRQRHEQRFAVRWQALRDLSSKPGISVISCATNASVTDHLNRHLGQRGR
ncbi:MAG: DUF58 domain-containing protein [Magnetococcales bacterium]|nr:DUF58 domain-containing protein [Magnetococcales bacterium]